MYLNIEERSLIPLSGTVRKLGSYIPNYRYGERLLVGWLVSRGHFGGFGRLWGRPWVSPPHGSQAVLSWLLSSRLRWRALA